MFSDLDVGAVKIGMLSQPDTIRAVADGLEQYRQNNIVLDPVMVAASGDRLLAPEAIEVLRTILIPRALVVTPNLPEAAAILETTVATNESEMREQGEKILALGCRAVLVKGGHAAGAESVDLLVEPTAVARLAAERVATAEHPRDRLHAVLGDRGRARQGARSRARACARPRPM